MEAVCNIYDKKSLLVAKHQIFKPIGEKHELPQQKIFIATLGSNSERLTPTEMSAVGYWLLNNETVIYWNIIQPFK